MPTDGEGMEGRDADGALLHPAPDLSATARVLKDLLPHGYSLIHSRHRWWVKKWDSWVQNGTARMTWKDIDDDTDLAELLERLGEHS